MEIVKKFLSRRLLVLGVFGFVAPVVFQSMGINHDVTLASIALGACYLGQRALKG